MLMFCFILYIRYCTGENYRDMLPCDVFVLNTHNMRWSAIPKPDENTYNPDTCDWPYQVCLF